MEHIQEEINNLYNKDANLAYASLKHILKCSEEGDELYPYMEEFIQMMHHENSYVRTRGLLAFAMNARWDTKNLVDQHIHEYISHMEDDKPITSRQCIQHLHQIARYKPELCPLLLESVSIMNKEYGESMQPLLYKDRKKAARQIQQWMCEHEDEKTK